MTEKETIQLYGRKSIDDQSLFVKFPIIFIKEEKLSLLLYLFQVNGIPNYLVLGKLKDDYLPKLEDTPFWSWLNTLNQILNFDLCSSSLDSSYLNNMNIIWSSPISNKIEWTQEGFDIISGKQNFVKNGEISRTVKIPYHQNGKTCLFENKFFDIRDSKESSLFSPIQIYLEQYFLSVDDKNRMTDEQRRSYYLFHRYRLVRYVRRLKDESLQFLCQDAFSSDLNIASDASIQLLDYVFMSQFEKENHPKVI